MRDPNDANSHPEVVARGPGRPETRRGARPIEDPPAVTWRDRAGRPLTEWAGGYRDRRLAQMRDVLVRFNWRDKYDGSLEMLRAADTAEEAVELSALAARRLGVPATELWLAAMHAKRKHA